MKFYPAEKYQEKCKARFEYYRDQIVELIPTARIEHIGASSIPNAISKGDLDILVGVDEVDLEHTVQLLLSLGFSEKSNTLRTNELCMLESNDEDVALQIVANGSEFEFFLTFRDTLKSDPNLIKQYNELKLACTGLSHAQYRKRKSEFIEGVISSAII